MLRVSILFICLLLFACTSTKVHLYTRYLSEQEISIISKKLTKANFEVVPNTFVFPDDIQQSTLLYSPLVKDQDSVNVLLDSLHGLGWVIPTVQPLFAGNHSYTKNSIGLFILPEGGKDNAKLALPDLVHEYQSKKCDVSVKLRLNRNNTYQLFYADESQVHPAHVNGSWEVTGYPYLQLMSANKIWSFYFEIQKQSEVDQISKVDIIKLKAMNTHHIFPNCSFYYGLRI